MHAADSVRAVFNRTSRLYCFASTDFCYCSRFNDMLSTSHFNCDAKKGHNLTARA
jgi:hypothetical protein